MIFEQRQKEVRKHFCQFPRKEQFRYKANAYSVWDQNKVRGLKGSGVARDQFRYDIGHYHMLLFFKSVEILSPRNHTLFSLGLLYVSVHSNSETLSTRRPPSGSFDFHTDSSLSSPCKRALPPSDGSHYPWEDGELLFLLLIPWERKSKALTAATT